LVAAVAPRTRRPKPKSRLRTPSSKHRRAVRRAGFAALLGAVVVFALGSCGGSNEDVSPSYQDRIPPGIRLEAGSRTIGWRKSVDLTGRLTQGGDPVSGETVTLEADSYPFDGQFHSVGSAQTGARGDFAFEDAPEANTTYRVAAGDLSETHSNERRVYVLPNMRLSVAGAAGGTRYTTTFHHPKDRSIAGSSLYSYATASGGDPRFVRVTRVRQVHLGLSEASIVLPYAVGEAEYTTCVGYTPDSGLGPPGDHCTQGKAPVGSAIVG
jgi:hypothetical protein